MAKKAPVAEPAETAEQTQDGIRDPKVSPAKEAMNEEARLRKQRAETEKEQKKDPEKTQAEQIADSREALKKDLPPGMAFYESPEGYVVVAESGRGTVWCHQANNGKGMKINPKR